ncbi:MAG: ABC transporter permease [Planctomycetota bacterium]|jgi:ribose transport system permease protein|nr:ABC transporter permease [Planctomycetota bacterium]
MIPQRSRFNLVAFAPYIALLLMLLVGSLTSEHFFQLRNVLNITRQVSYTGIIALGMTFVIIAGGIDLSVGSAVAFIGGVVVLSINHIFLVVWPGAEYTAFCLAFIAGLAVGLVGSGVSGFLITKFNIPPFIATLGFMGIYRSLALYIGDGGEFRVTGSFGIFSRFGTGLILGVPTPSIIFFLLAAVFSLILNWTRFGRYVCAIGSNEKVASYAAVRVAMVRMLTYIICGGTVALSTFLLAARMNSINSTNAGNLYELDAIAAVVIGGTAMTGGSGSMAGTVAGAMILGIINNILNMWGVSAYLQGTVKGLIIVLAVLIQRQEFQDLVKEGIMRIFRLREKAK